LYMYDCICMTVYVFDCDMCACIYLGVRICVYVSEARIVRSET